MTYKLTLFAWMLFASLITFSISCKKDSSGPNGSSKYKCATFFADADDFSEDFKATQVTTDFANFFTKDEKYHVIINDYGVVVSSNGTPFHFPKETKTDCNETGSSIILTLNNGNEILTLTIQGKSYSIVFHEPGTTKQANLKY